MKIIMMTDGSKDECQKISKDFDDPFVVDTSEEPENEDEEKEYTYLMSNIENFILSGKDRMLIRFSGRELIADTVGGETSEMFLCLSHKKGNPNYVECPEKAFVDTVKLLENV